jgi:hypothetical protein
MLLYLPERNPAEIEVKAEGNLLRAVSHPEKAVVLYEPETTVLALEPLDFAPVFRRSCAVLLDVFTLAFCTFYFFLYRIIYRRVFKYFYIE